MKTAIIEKIEDHQTIKAFSSLAVDPESTKVAARATASEDDLANNIRQSIKNTNSEMQSLRKQMGKLLAEGRKVQNSQLPDKDKQLKKLEGRYLVKEEEVNQKREQLKDHYRDLKARTDEILKQSLIFFEPTSKEARLTDDQHLELTVKKKSLAEHEILTLEGKVLIDKRGVEYWQKKNQKWGKTEISALGEDVPEEGKVELTPDEQREVWEQEETDRIKGLTSERKQFEKEMALEGVMNQAAIFKSKLELQEDSDALTKAKAWLKTEEDKVKEKYL